MGQMLSEPVTEKHTSSGANERFEYGASAMQVNKTHTCLLTVV